MYGQGTLKIVGRSVDPCLKRCLKTEKSESNKCRSIIKTHGVVNT